MNFFNATQRNLHIIMKMRCATIQALWSSQDTKCIHSNIYDINNLESWICPFVSPTTDLIVHTSVAL